MRLLYTSDYTLHTFSNKVPKKYAILSHTWVEDQEVSYKELVKGRNKQKTGWDKIQQFCNVARNKGFEWCWVDTCCIDKTSSADLQESINLMFRYYREASLCIVYLADVPARMGCEIKKWEQLFSQSKWFTRGWTLQELLAPIRVDFWPKDWTVCLGGKQDKRLQYLIVQTTQISRQALENFSPSEWYAAEILQWASRRECSRQEDEAYSLLGLLKVNMPLLYGEGPRAFLRLQQEVLNSEDDESVLVWKPAPDMEGDQFARISRMLFAPSARCFGGDVLGSDATESTPIDPYASHRRPSEPEEPRKPLSALAESSRPLMPCSRGLRAERTLYKSRRYADVFYMALEAPMRPGVRDSADHVLQLRPSKAPNQSGDSRLKAWPQLARLNYAVCHRTSLLSLQKLGDSITEVTGGPFEVLILRLPPH